jgi:hypothetical protein
MSCRGPTPCSCPSTSYKLHLEDCIPHDLSGRPRRRARPGKRGLLCLSGPSVSIRQTGLGRWAGNPTSRTLVEIHCGLPPFGTCVSLLLSTCLYFSLCSGYLGYWSLSLPSGFTSVGRYVCAVIMHGVHSVATRASLSLLKLSSLLLPFVAAQDSVSYDFDSYGASDPSGTPYQTYMSNAYVKPPQMQINRNGTALQSGYVFLGINGLPTSGQNWPAIFGTFLCFPGRWLGLGYNPAFGLDQAYRVTPHPCTNLYNQNSRMITWGRSCGQGTTASPSISRHKLTRANLYLHSGLESC